MTVPSPTMVTLDDTGFVECRWWNVDCENCRHLTVVGLHDTGPWTVRHRVNVYKETDCKASSCLFGVTVNSGRVHACHSAASYILNRHEAPFPSDE